MRGILTCTRDRRTLSQGRGGGFSPRLGREVRRRRSLRLSLGLSVFGALLALGAAGHAGAGRHGVLRDPGAGAAWASGGGAARGARRGRRLPRSQPLPGPADAGSGRAVRAHGGGAEGGGGASGGVLGNRRARARLPGADAGGGIGRLRPAGHRDGAPRRHGAPGGGAAGGHRAAHRPRRSDPALGSYRRRRRERLPRLLRGRAAGGARWRRSGASTTAGSSGISSTASRSPASPTPTAWRSISTWAATPSRARAPSRRRGSRWRPTWRPAATSR